MADDSAGTTMPFVHLRNPVSPPSLFQDAERPDKCLESALLALYTVGFRARPHTPLPTIAIMHAITAELHTEQGRDTCLVGTLGH